MFFLKIVVFIFQKIPLRYLHRLGDLLGLSVYYLNIDRRKVAETNLKIVLGEDFNRKIVKENFKNSFRSIMEMFFVTRIDDQFVKENLIYGDLKDAYDIKDKKIPTFLLTGHVGSWELLPAIYSVVFDHEISVIGKSMKNKAVDRVMVDLRMMDKVHFIKHKSALRIIHRYLNNGIPVGALLDQGALDRQSVFVDFFGLKTTFTAGLPLYAFKKNIRFLMAFLVRDGGKYKVVLYPPIYPDKSMGVDEGVLEISRRINEVYEDIIKKYPEQWFSLHKRFKRVLRDGDEQTSSIYR
ncbi:MAG: hypothetical protein LDL13_03830 [Calditerrivibrio sp.]|nr:hypothetical protein [Calditerrivibrio sp.]MCA1932688.1 hypothetical protein [Calditerrivibrio sp.]MCA1980759.1 hypothetical protein [Calditerrivibrio sp.]